MDEAEMFFQQTGTYVFGDNEFAFRQFGDVKEYETSIASIRELPLIAPSPKIMTTLNDAVEKALVEIERRCVGMERNNPLRNPSEIRNGAWQLYREVQTLIPELISSTYGRRDIAQKAEINGKPLALAELLSSYF